MKYNFLGSTGLKVSAISLGCSGYWGQRIFSEKKAHKIIWEGLNLGINYFDTGHNYCKFNAEPRLGRVLRDIIKANDRSKIIVSSKAGTIIPSASIFSKKRSQEKDFSPESIERSCEASIKNLTGDYLDIFHLHGVSQNEMTDDLITKLCSMKDKGLYRYLGVNTHDISFMTYMASKPDVFDVALVDYNVLQLDREPIIEKMNDSGIGVVAGTVLAQGHILKGKIGTVKTVADMWYLARAYLKSEGRALASKSTEMRNLLASTPEISPAQAAIAFVLNNRSVASCTIGTTKLSNLSEIASSTEIQLSEKLVNTIRDTYTHIKAH